MPNNTLKFSKNTFRKFFFLYFVLLLSILIISFTVAIIIINNERENKVNASCLENSRSITNEINAEFNTIHNISSSLRNSTWVTKLMSNTTVFEREFDILRQKEISLELNNFAAVNKTIEDVTVIYPQKNMAVNSKGWWDTDEYFRYTSKIYQLKENAIKDKISSENNTFGILTQQDFCYNDANRMIMLQQLELTENPRAIAVITINKSSMKHLLLSLMNEQLVDITINNTNGDVLIEAQNSYKGDKSFYKNSCSSFLFDVNAGYAITSSFITGNDLLLFISVGVILFIAIVVLSYGLASINYSPLSKIIARINSNKSGAFDRISSNQSEYKYIENKVQDLFDEKETMQKNVALLKEEAKRGLYLQLLRGFFKSGMLYENLSEYEIPYTNELYYCVMVLEVSQFSENNQLLTDDEYYELIGKIMFLVNVTLKEIKCNAKVIDTFDNNLAIIFAFDEASDLPQKLNDISVDINEKIMTLCCSSVEILIGKPHKSIIGISISYQEAKSTTVISANESGEPASDMYYYPTDWEQQFIANLKIGNHFTVKSILDEIEKENARLNLSDKVLQRLLLLVKETIARVAFEINISADEIPEIYNNNVFVDWNKLYDLADCVCKKTSSSDVEMIDDVNNDILTYINQNYANSEISLKTISNEFNLSVPSVSRIFKEAVGINFHEYVTGLRMERAKELLKQNGYDIKAIAQTVGYDSEYSFKRAFLRIESIKPREYAEKFSASNDIAFPLDI